MAEISKIKVDTLTLGHPVFLAGKVSEFSCKPHAGLKDNGRQIKK